MNYNENEKPVKIYSTRRIYNGNITIPQIETLGELWGEYKRHYTDLVNDELYFEMLSACKTEQERHDCRDQYGRDDKLEEYYYRLAEILYDIDADERAIIKCQIKALIYDYKHIKHNDIGFEPTCDSYKFPFKKFRQLYNTLIEYGEPRAAEHLRTYHIKQGREFRCKIARVRNYKPKTDHIKVMIHNYLSRVGINDNILWQIRIDHIDELGNDIK